MQLEGALFIFKLNPATMSLKIPLENFVVIDIETVSQAASLQQLSPEWQYLWIDKIKHQLSNDSSPEMHYTQKASLMAEFAKIVCISLGYFKKEGDGYQLRMKSIAGHDEHQLLQDFLTTIHQIESVNHHWNFAGHNIKEFDIPFLCRRLLINHLAIPWFLTAQTKKPWESNIVDTLQYWRFGEFKNFTSLRLLTTTLGINPPTLEDLDMDGSKIGQIYWADGDLERIKGYCEKDVFAVANIILRLKDQPILQSEAVVLSR